MNTIAQELSAQVEARLNCIALNNQEWLLKWEAKIKELQSRLPSGSGIDRGTKIDLENSTPQKLIFNLGYHHMDDNGFYNGWTDHQAIVTPNFRSFNIKITGRNKNQIKDYLSETLYIALNQPLQP